MRLLTLKRILGAVSLLCHFVGLLFIFIAGFRRDEFNNAYELSVVLAPMTSVYGAAFLRDLVSNQTNFDESYIKQTVDTFAFYTQIAIVGLFACLLIVCTGSLLIFPAIEFSQTKTFIVIIESVFGVFVGLIFETLFGKVIRSKD